MKSIIKTITIIILLGVGFVAGLLIRNIPYITLKHEIGISDIANFVVVLMIAIITPLVFNQWQDNKRFAKNFIIDEIKSIIKESEKIKNVIDNCAIQAKTDDINKKTINMFFQRLDSKINSLTTQFEISFKKSIDLKDKLEAEYLKYWKATTGGELMSDNFSIDQNFCRLHNVAFSSFETCLKKSIHIINNL